MKKQRPDVDVNTQSVHSRPPTPEPSGEQSPTVSPDALHRRIAEAAYYLAERRGFAPGYEEQDWLDAERAIGAPTRSAT